MELTIITLTRSRDTAPERVNYKCTLSLNALTILIHSGNKESLNCPMPA